MSNLYEKVLDTFLILRDVRERFSTYSSTDIKKLIAVKMKSIREPLALKHLYELEKAIANLRESLEKEKLSLVDSAD